MPAQRTVLATALIFLAGCNSFILAPSSSHLDLVQATRLSEDQSQVSLAAGALNGTLAARQTFGMGNDTAGDVGLNLSLFHSALDGGLWLPMERTAVRLGLTGGVGQAGFSAAVEEHTPDAGFGLPAFGGGSIHVQHLLGKKQKRKTAWTFTHGYGFTNYVVPTPGYEAMFSVNIDAAFRADFNAREDKGLYTAFGLGANLFIPNLSLRLGYRL